jgi:hypothetical protein
MSNELKLFFALLPGVIILILGVGAIINYLVRRKHETRNNDDDFSSAWLRERIAKANKSVEIISGSCPRTIFNETLIETIRKRVKIKPKLSIRLITGPNCDNEDLYALEGDLAPNFQFIKTAVRPRLHFRIIDGSYLFIERYHDHGITDRTVDIYKYEIFKAAEYRKIFDRFWNQNLNHKSTYEKRSSEMQLAEGL